MNNVPHIGHIVGSHLPADIFARYMRLRGHEVVFVGGTDEHGSATEITALKYGVTPKELCDYYYRIHREIYQWFRMSYDIFSRTSNPVHHETTQDIFLQIYRNGYIIEKEQEVPYCPHDRIYLPDRFVEGTCPYCGYEKARGDQCEKCGALLDPKDLINPRCAVCGRSDIEFRKRKHLYLDLPKIKDKLRTWIEKQTHWRPGVRNWALSLVDDLKERSITRDLKWGVKVPLKGYEDKVFYVWFDAPIGYISFAKEIGKEDFWHGARIYHFLGKDNIPFHTVFWPAMLLMDGRYSLPYNVVGLQFLNYEGGKMSKSRNWGVFCDKLPGTLDPDYWRFYLTFLIPENRDMEFLWSEFEEKINKELVGNLSNFIYRVLHFSYSRFDGMVSGDPDEAFLYAVRKKAEEVGQLYEQTSFRKALSTVLEISSLGNNYLQEKEPWKLINKDYQSAVDVMVTGANVVKILSILMAPVIPGAAEKTWKMLGMEKKMSWAEIEATDRVFRVSKPTHLFEALSRQKIEEVKARVTVAPGEPRIR